ncbi:MAG: hypothetical protein ACHQ53_10235 [Polyangiales bacterium]
MQSKGSGARASGRFGFYGWLMLAATLAACSAARPGEYGEEQCSNHCDDPDCWGTATCRVYAKTAAVQDAGMDAAPKHAAASPDAASTDRDSAVAMDAGAALQIAPLQIGDAAPLPADAGPAFVDAAARPPPCDPVCKTDEVCTDGQCTAVAVETSGKYQLTIVSANAPDQSPTSRCYDTLCANPLSAVPYGLCLCDVDPYVVVTRIRNGVETKIGMTSIVMDQPNPMYVDATFIIDLMRGDILRFDVWDHNDMPVADQLLFECKPNLTNLMPGPIGCTTLAGPLYAQLVGVSADLELAP